MRSGARSNQRLPAAIGQSPRPKPRDCNPWAFLFGCDVCNSRAELHEGANPFPLVATRGDTARRWVRFAGPGLRCTSLHLSAHSRINPAPRAGPWVRFARSRLRCTFPHIPAHPSPRPARPWVRFAHPRVRVNGRQLGSTAVNPVTSRGAVGSYCTSALALHIPAHLRTSPRAGHGRHWVRLVACGATDPTMAYSVPVPRPSVRPTPGPARRFWDILGHATSLSDAFVHSVVKEPPSATGRAKGGSREAKERWRNLAATSCCAFNQGPR